MTSADWNGMRLRLMIVLAWIVVGVACGTPTKPPDAEPRASAERVTITPGTVASVEAEPSLPEADATSVGQFASLTGAHADFGRSSSNGVKLALRQKNAAGGVNGKPIRLAIVDTQSTPEGATAGVTRLIDEQHAVAIIGEVASSLSLAGATVAQKRGVPMISPSSTNPALTRIGDRIFRACFLDAYQGYAVARFAHDDRKLTRVAVLSDPSQEYAKTLAESFDATFGSLGGKIVAREKYASSDASVATQLGAIQKAKAQAVFLPGYHPDAARFVVEARKLGMKQTFLGGDGLDSPDFAAAGGQAVEGAYYANHFAVDDPRPEAQRFVSAYKAEYGAPPDVLAALGYDAANLVLHALERARSMSGADIAAALGSTQGFPGVTGPIGIDAERNAVRPAVILVIRKGKAVYAASIEK